LRTQVTIIHGETGCGKSSTVPLMLLRSHDRTRARALEKLRDAGGGGSGGNGHWSCPACQASVASAKQQCQRCLTAKPAALEAAEALANGRSGVPLPAKMFVTQPRRIAARALCNRVKLAAGATASAADGNSGSGGGGGSSGGGAKGSLIGLRLGHGERSDDSSLTRIWFATTGYVVLLLAHHPETFKDHSHLVIDEVHERSVDTDILCLLARKLLHTHPTLKLVLMSATVAAKLYQQYFGSPEPPLFVGAKRFPVAEVFAEDLPRALQLPAGSKLATAASTLAKNTAAGGDRSAQSAKLQLDLALHVARTVGRPGSAVLIFVAGMAEIVDLVDKFEALNESAASSGGTTYKVVAIHSEIPDEEQAEAFKTDHEREVVKVIVATNAAESSITVKGHLDQRGCLFLTSINCTRFHMNVA
jgi:ATP-dependent RNA helicase DHX29